MFRNNIVSTLFKRLINNQAKMESIFLILTIQMSRVYHFKTLNTIKVLTLINSKMRIVLL